MKKYSRMFSILFLVGFTGGIFCTNLFIKETGYQTSLLSLYLADAVQREKGKPGLFGELLVKRGGFFLFGAVLWSDAFRRSNGFCQSCLVWVSGRESDDSVFVGLWNKGDFSGDAVFSAAVLFLPSRLAVVFLFCHANGAESLGKQKEGKSRLPCLFFLSLPVQPCVFFWVSGRKVMLIKPF